jgi:uncharacterized protein YndB with AHSA1/START domain
LDGETHNVSGVYREVAQNRRLVFTWQWVTMPERESLVTIDLRPSADGTELTFTHSQFYDEAGRDNHLAGWPGCFDKLEAFLATESLAAQLPPTPVLG